MGSRGPVKKAKLHAVKGAADERHDRDFRPEQPPAFYPDEPDWKHLVGGRDKTLLADCHKEWEFTVRELQRRGMLTKTDVTTVVDYCLCHGRVLQCERRLSNKGFLIPGANGPVKNPVAQLLAMWRQSEQKHRDSLGLSPMALRRLGREEEPPPDDDSDLDEKPPV